MSEEVKGSGPKDVFMVLSIFLTASGCTRHVTEMPVPNAIGLKIYEERMNDSFAAPDSLRVYLAANTYEAARRNQPIFEAQDAGTVCYEWVGSNDLHIKISDGYVDSVQSSWKGVDGRLVTVSYKGKVGCSWRREK